MLVFQMQTFHTKNHLSQIIEHYVQHKNAFWISHHFKVTCIKSNFEDNTCLNIIHSLHSMLLHLFEARTNKPKRCMIMLCYNFHVA